MDGRKFLLIGALLGMVVSCSTPGPARYGDSEYDDQPTPESQDLDDFGKSLSEHERRHYQEIQTLYSNGAASAALERIVAFKRKYPRSRILARVENIHGLVMLSQNKNTSAAKRFRRALKLTKRVTFQQYVYFNLATAYYEAGKIRNSDQVLRKMLPARLNAPTRIKFHYLSSLVLYRLKLYENSAEEVLRSSFLLDAIASDSHLLHQTVHTFERQLSRAVDQLDNAQILERLYSQYEDTPLGGALLYKLGMAAKAESKDGSAENYFQTGVSRYPKSLFYVKSVDQLRKLQTTVETDHRAVGVLLPLSGRFSKFGALSLQGIELAFRFFNRAEPDSQVTIYIEDSGETPEQALAALEKLYREHHVVAILGPLLSKGVEEVTKRAEELGVPIISLAQQKGFPGENVFYSSITPRDQAYEIARYAIQKRGMTRFAILYPKDGFGEEHTQHFWDAVEELGGEIVGVESYASGETDFRVPVDKLLGTHYKQARQLELEELKALREKDGITKRNRKTEQYFKLPPIIDFDAVFIPDEAKTISQILPTFAFRDAEEVQYLGTSTWNSDGLFRRAQKYAEGAIFTDSFFKASTAPVTRDFIHRYESTFGKSPTVIEALSYDAGLLLERTLLTLGDSVSRSDVRETLAITRDFPGVTGMISYEDGQFRRQLKVLTVENQRVVEAF